jgi:tRNA (guanine-N7-)-methyltransferase
MSRRNKLAKFAQLSNYPNVYENFAHSEETPMLTAAGGNEAGLRGQWGKAHFQNNLPITLELACGRGEYCLGLARRYPERNFIGVDIKGARIWQGATIALEENLSNIAFLRTRIEQLNFFFAPQEVSEIWITFPDPFLKDTKANRRLTAPGFLSQYKKLLKPGGVVHLKTDESHLVDFTLQTLEVQPDWELEFLSLDIDQGLLPLPELEILTHYERMHRGKGIPIKYLRFRSMDIPGMSQP